MIRTFLIYSMIDRCIDLFFDRVEMILMPVGGLRLGDRFSRLSRINSGIVNDIECILLDYYDCVVSGFSSDRVCMSVERIKYTYRGRTVDGANRFVAMNSHCSYNVTFDACEISFTKYLNGDVVVIDMDEFNECDVYY